MANITYIPPRKNKASNIKIDDVNNNFQSNDVEGALNEVANYSLVKHTDGLIYIKRQDGTLIGTGIEVGGSADLSTLSMSVSGQTLKLLNGNTELSTVAIPTATVTDEQLKVIIQGFVDAGTLIPDGSITLNKTNFLTKTSENLIDVSSFSNSGYGGTNFDEFGANINVFETYINTSVIKELYYRFFRNNVVNDVKINITITCYDENKIFLYKMNDSTGDYTSNFSIVRFLNVENDSLIIGGTQVRSKAIGKVVIPENVKYVKFGIWKPSAMVEAWYSYFLVSSNDITDFDNPSNVTTEVIDGNFSSLVKKINQYHYGKSLAMIGDSLTNWGGGSDKEGFLKIVHDRTGLSTSNLGLAGAMWQQEEGQTQSGVQRVNKIIADNLQYDFYVFLLGTNGGSETDTGENSSNTTTMCGAIRYCMEKIIGHSPTSNILVCLPPQRQEGNEKQKLVNEVIKKIVNYYGVPTLDLYNEGRIIPNTVVPGNGTLSDGLHLSDNGKYFLGNSLAARINLF